MNTSSTVKLPPPNWKLILHSKVPLEDGKWEIVEESMEASYTNVRDPDNYDVTLTLSGLSKSDKEPFKRGCCFTEQSARGMFIRAVFLAIADIANNDPVGFADTLIYDLVPILELLGLKVARS